MKLGKKDPELFTVVTGNPWTINGEISPARSPREAVLEVLSIAERFPVRINVHDREQIIALEMDKQGRTRSVAGADHTPEIDEQPEDDQRRVVTPLRLVGAVAVILALGTGSVIAFTGSDEEQQESPAAVATPEPAATPGDWKLPGGQDAIAVLRDRVITAEGTTVRILDAMTGDQVGESYEVQKPAQIRFIEGTTASAFDAGAGRVVLLRDGSAEVIEGVLNARGTEPVIVREADFSAAEGDKRPLEERQTVLAATSEGVVLFESPGTVVFGGRSVALKAPEAGAGIVQVIGAAEGRLAVVWSLGKARWLTTHDAGSGEPILHEDIAAAEVTVRAGIVWVGADRFLVDDRIEQVCQGGQQVSAVVICPGADGWESADQSLRFSERPEVISQSYSVIAGTVSNIRKEQ